MQPPKNEEAAWVYPGGLFFKVVLRNVEVVVEAHLCVSSLLILLSTKLNNDETSWQRIA